MKTLLRLLFQPITLLAMAIATFVIWIMEDEAKFIQTWQELKDASHE